MSRWFRFYDDAINDPKVQRLSGEKFKAWVAVLCIASKNNGRLPSTEHLAFLLRTTRQRATETVALLHTAGLLDKDENGFFPHNWNGRQYKSDVSTERVKRFRKRDRNVSVTPPDTDTESETETESEKRERERRAREGLASQKEEKQKALQKEEKPKPIHPDWHPNDDGIAAAHDAGLTDAEIDRLARKFVAHYRANGATRTNWDEQWKAWCLDEGAKKPKPPEDVSAAAVNWPRHLAFFRKTGHWPRGLGPEPYQLGCQVPVELLAQHGLAPMEKTA